MYVLQLSCEHDVRLHTTHITATEKNLDVQLGMALSENSMLDARCCSGRVIEPSPLSVQWREEGLQRDDVEGCQCQQTPKQKRNTSRPRDFGLTWQPFSRSTKQVDCHNCDSHNSKTDECRMSMTNAEEDELGDSGECRGGGAPTTRQEVRAPSLPFFSNSC